MHDCVTILTTIHVKCICNNVKQVVQLSTLLSCKAFHVIMTLTNDILDGCDLLVRAKAYIVNNFYKPKGDSVLRICSFTGVISKVVY